MAYLGNAPARSFISFERQVFTIVNSQTAYALSHSVTNENDIRLVVNNVVQEPGSGKAYTATGTALTLSAALTNGTDEMYCVFLGRATATNAPGAGSVGTSQLANDAVTLAKMASGTDGNIISYDASGNPVAVATGNDGQVLTSAGAGAPPVFETPVSAANTPAFEAYLGGSGGQALSNDTVTKVQFQTELYDTNNTYDNSSNYRFTPGVAGKYFIYASLLYDTSGNDQLGPHYIYFKKNGSYVLQNLCNPGTHYFRQNFLFSSAVVDSDDNDYFEVFARVNTVSGSGQLLESDTQWTRATKFGAYRIIT